MNVRVLAAGITTSAALLITACGGGAEQPPAHEPPAHDQQSQHGQHSQHDQRGEAEFNEADVAFARNMVPHHEQAVRMSEQVPSRTEQPQVRELANRIGSAQRPEIERMNGWLRDWNAGPDRPGQHGAHQMPGGQQMPGGHQMHGMMGPEQMADLERARGSDFDREWVRMMIEHHRGAVEMARTEQDRGRNPEAKQLAGHMVDSQRAEIDEMSALLTRL